MDKTIDLNTISSATIDDLLDEIHENEQKHINNNNNNNDVNWNDILKHIRNGNINFIKNLIQSNDISINAHNPIDGKTLLIYAVIVGNINLCKTICNFGADVHCYDDDNLDALDYAIKYGRYNITELIYKMKLSGSLGNDLKTIATKIYDKNKQAELMKDFEFQVSQHHDKWASAPISFGMVEYMTEAIKNRSEFGEDMLYYAWYFLLNAGTVRKWVKEDKKYKYVPCDEPFKSNLWRTMMRTYEEILSDTSDKKGWKWLKLFFINSLIWYLPHPTNSNDNNNGDNEDNNEENMEKTLKKTLFSELSHQFRFQIFL